MDENWQDITKEKFEARQNFFAELFPKWKTTFCQEMGQRDVRFFRLTDKIVWRSENGVEYNPRKLCNLYFGDYRYKAKFLMKERSKLLDRHKIVALTQHMILEHFPITYSFEKPFDRSKIDLIPISTRFLNVSFAYHFALEFLRAWNKEEHEKKLEVPFDSDSLFKCLESTEFAREQYKFLMLDLEYPFPSFLVSQLWFALERWGLSDMRQERNQ